MAAVYFQVRNNRHNHTASSGFSLIELLVVIGIIAILTAILLPVFLSVRSSAHASQCLSNQRQLGSALLLYAQDNDGRFPRGSADGGDTPGMKTPPKQWDNLIFPYVKNREVFHCPACSVPALFELPQPAGWPESLSHGYGLNGSLQEATAAAPGVTLPHVAFPATTVAFAEFSYRASSYGSFFHPITMTFPDDERSIGPAKDSRFVGAPGALRHRGGSNYTFVDGHVKWYTPSQVRDSNTPNEGITPTFSL